MIIYADLHIHSKYSRATSAKMNIDEIARFAPIKGLNIVGTGDFTHPKWFRELREKLIEVSDTGLYKPLKKPDSPLYFMITGEVSTAFIFEGKLKRIHHLILSPSLEVADQIRYRLSKYGDLSVDGRPFLQMT
ncbi:MAG TPA: DNA helicase UvrD, partial [Candidatus Bathyarchaeota archaeon]|nr:DNA helicase UvrD [Candidatus Bathyarchaeota archaeon]